MAWGLARISSAELAEWIAFDRIDPIGRDRDDWRAARISAVIAEVWRNKKERREPFTAEDFMPKWGGSEAESDDGRRQFSEWSTAEQVALFEMLVVAFGGQDLRDKNGNNRASGS